MIKKAKLAVVVLMFVVAIPATAKKNKHPFDIYDHDMHTPLFEAVSLACETCHADPESYGDRTKVNRLGCHTCHNNSKPPIEASQDCQRCHEGGPPKPPSHKVDWLARHQVDAKGAVASCQQCHTNAMFCVNCHERRDTIQQVVHRRNFRFFHSIEARANPRKCDACHTVTYCQQCHAGRGTSLR